MAKWEAKVLKAGDKLLVELPEEVLAKKKLARGDYVVFIEDMQGRIQIENRKTIDAQRCDICQKGERRNTCISCGRKVCSNCYFNMAGICHACGNFPKRRRG